MDEFEKLLAEVSSGVDRFVRYRLPSQTDADDVLQEVYLSAYRKFPQLKNKDAFKSWIISIARQRAFFPLCYGTRSGVRSGKRRALRH